MKLTPALKAALVASTIALTGASCKPQQDQHKAEVERILSAVQPTADDTLASRKYYESRKDLQNLSPDEKFSLTLSHARLSVLAEGIKTGKISTQDFLAILQSKEHIITDGKTKLILSNYPAVDINRISVVGDEIEVSTGRETADIIKNPKTEVLSKGGTLTVTFTGEGFKCLYNGGDKGHILARDKSTLTPSGEQSITITASLVLATK